MRRIDQIKLSFTRSWNFPGKEQLSHRFKQLPQLKAEIKDRTAWNLQ